MEWLEFMSIAPMIVASAIGAAGSLLGGAKSASGARDVNQQQIDMTYDLTKNKHKYAMEDLKQSGLNPLLSATTPQSVGSAPKLENPDAHIGKGISESANSAMDMSIKQQTLDNMAEQQGVIRNQMLVEGERFRSMHMENNLQQYIKGLKEQGWDIIDGVVTYVGDKLNYGDNAGSNASSAKTLPDTNQLPTAPKPKPTKLTPRGVTTSKDPSWSPSGMTPLMDGLKQYQAGAKPVTVDWLQKNIKSYSEWKRIFGTDHWANKKPKIGSKDYWQRMKAYRYVQFLKGNYK